MNILQRFLRWWNYRKLAIAGIGLILVILLIIREDIAAPEGIWENIQAIADGAVTEFVGILFTVAVLDWLNDRRATEIEKNDLILQMGSPDNAFAREAVRKLRVRGWGFEPDRSLAGVNLREADLHGADLGKANLDMVDLTRANLQGTSLMRSNLREASLFQANLEGADLFKANLQEVDLRGARVTDAQLAETGRMWGATLSDGSRYDGQFALTGDLEDARKAAVDVENPQELARWYAKRRSRLGAN